MMSEPLNQYSESCRGIISKFNELLFHNKAKLHLFSLNEAKCPKYFLETMPYSFIKGRYFYNKKKWYQNSFCKMGDTLCGLKINAEFS